MRTYALYGVNREGVYTPIGDPTTDYEALLSEMKSLESGSEYASVQICNLDFGCMRRRVVGKAEEITADPPTPE